MKPLRHDPIGPLLAADDAALRSMARRELLGETTPEINTGELAGMRRIVARQQPDGRWKYPGGNPDIRSRAAYDQLETYRQLGVLVCKFGLDRHDPAVAAAAGFLSSCQTQAGDYRGIYGHQYTPNYSAAITELLIRAGYDGSAQVEKAMRWLLSMRQDDGGWAIPTRTLGMPLNVMYTARETVEPDRSRPSSHLITGIVDMYLAALGEPERATLTFLRDTIMAIVPEAEQGISYRMPAFKLRGKTTAGFAAFKSHLSYLPHSRSVIPRLAEETAAYTSTKGSLHFPVDAPLPESLVRKLLEVRMAETFDKG